MHKIHAEETKRAVREMREGTGFSERALARMFGISPATVRAWCDPKHAEQRSKEADARDWRKEPCESCGGRVRRGSRSGLCRRCYLLSQGYIVHEHEWTPRRIKEAMLAWNQQFGAPPTSSEWNKKGDDHPSYYQVRKYYQNWNEALSAAGLVRSDPSRELPRFIRRFDRTKARALRVKGLTDEEIGAQLGVSGSAIWQALGHRPERVRSKALKSREEREAALKRAIAKEKEAEAILRKENAS